MDNLLFSGSNSDLNLLFFQEDVEFIFKPTELLDQRIKEIIISETENEKATLSIIFCSDEYLLDINKRYLDHNYYTDIITFPYESSPLTADLFISIDRVRENAQDLGIPFTEELYRVILHGVLHLCGYGDSTPEEKNEMRYQEDHYLSGLI